MENTEMNRQMLNDIIHNARIGRDAVHFLLKKTDNPELQSELLRQERQYLDISKRAEERLLESGISPEVTNPLPKVGLWMGTQLSTLIDARDEHITELMMQGNEMGKLETERLLEKYPDAEPAIKKIASELVEMEESNISDVE